MQTFNWKNGVDGDWWQGRNWDVGVSPRHNDESVTLGLTGSYTVTAGSDPRNPGHGFLIGSLSISNPQATLQLISPVGGEDGFEVEGVLVNDGTLLAQGGPDRGYAGLGTGAGLTNAGTLILDSAYLTGAIDNSGLIDATGARGAAVGTFSNSGVANCGGKWLVSQLNNTGQMVFGQSTGSIADVAKVGMLSNGGTLRVMGASATHSAILEVSETATNSGTLVVGNFASIDKTHSYVQTSGETDVIGSLSASTISLTGGILEGTGSVVGRVSATGGAISGGDVANNAPGTLSIHGKLLCSGVVDATLITAGSGAASEIDVTGTKVSLNGASLNLNITDPANLHAGETFTVMTFTPDILTFGFSHMTDGTHTGDGNSLDLGNGFALDASYHNVGGDITLTVVDTPSQAEAPAMHHVPVIDWV